MADTIWVVHEWEDYDRTTVIGAFVSRAEAERMAEEGSEDYYVEEVTLYRPLERVPKPKYVKPKRTSQVGNHAPVASIGAVTGITFRVGSSAPPPDFRPEQRTYFG